MLHQIGTFNDIDTCNTTSFGNFYIKYILYAKDKSKSITKFPDINANLGELRQDDIISEYDESRKRAFENHFSSTI